MLAFVLPFVPRLAWPSRGKCTKLSGDRGRVREASPSSLAVAFDKEERRIGLLPGPTDGLAGFCGGRSCEFFPRPIRNFPIRRPRQVFSSPRDGVLPLPPASKFFAHGPGSLASDWSPRENRLRVLQVFLTCGQTSILVLRPRPKTCDRKKGSSRTGVVKTTFLGRLNAKLVSWQNRRC